MSRRALFPLLVVALILVSTTHPAEAQGTFGRLLLKISDQDGNPIEGVTATATCDELPDFLETKTTTKKGKLTLAFGDGTKVYNIKLEYPGSAPMEMPFKPQIRQTVTQEITIDLSGGAPQVSAGGPDSQPELTLTPTERIFNSGVELVQAGDFEGAKEKFLTAVKNRPDMAVAYSALGGVYLQLGDAQAALDTATKLLELEPESFRAQRILYEAHRRLGNEAEAQRALGVLTSQEGGGEAAGMIFNEGVEALEVGDRKTAKERFRQALELEPNLAPAMSALAIILLNDGEFAQAAELAEKLLTIEPDDSRAMNVTFDAYKALGDEDNERRAFERILASGSKDIGRLLYESGVELFNSGNLEAAEKNFRQALEADGSLATAHYHLGLCLVNMGDNVGAKEHFSKFLEMAPDDSEAPIAVEMLKALG